MAETFHPLAHISCSDSHIKDTQFPAGFKSYHQQQYLPTSLGYCSLTLTFTLNYNSLSLYHFNQTICQLVLAPPPPSPPPRTPPNTENTDNNQNSSAVISTQPQSQQMDPTGNGENASYSESGSQTGAAGPSTGLTDEQYNRYIAEGQAIVAAARALEAANANPNRPPSPDSNYVGAPSVIKVMLTRATVASHTVEPSEPRDNSPIRRRSR
jgi:hypothetical protein